MEKAKRDLKNTSIVLIALAAFELVSSLVSVFSPNGPFSAEAFIKTNDVTADVANVVVVVFVVLFVIGFLLQLFVGLKGIIVANGGNKSKLVTVIVVINIIFLVLGAIGSVGNIVDGSTTILQSQIIIQVCELILYGFYISGVKKVINLRATTV